MGRAGTANGWHFLTGDRGVDSPRHIGRRVHLSVGRRTHQFAHVSGLLVATPDGRLARYFYGVEYSPRDLRLALIDSGNGMVGSVVDELLLYCFQYDPSHGRYGAVFMNIMRLGSALTVCFIAGFHPADAAPRDAIRRGEARLSAYGIWVLTVS